MNAARKQRIKEAHVKSSAKTEASAEVVDPPKPNPILELRALYTAGNNPGALALAGQLLAENPNDVDTLLVVARIHNKEKDWKQALEHWTKLSTLNPSLLEPHLQIARIYQRNLDWSKASTEAQAVVQLQADHLEAVKICFVCCWKLGSHADAATTAIRVFELGGLVEQSVALKLAAYLFDHSQQALAAKLATAYAKVDPSGTEGAKLQSRMLANMCADALAAHLEGYEDAAAEACRDILAAVPDHVRAGEILGQIVRPTLLKARAAFKADSFDEAKKEYTEVLRISPDHIESVRALGRLGWKMQDYATAALYWSRLEKLNPADGEPALQLARIFARTGDVEQAYLRFRALLGQGGAVAVEADQALPNLTKRLHRLAVISTRDGPLDEAYRLTKLLIDTQPGCEGLPELIERLARVLSREASNAFKAGDFEAAAKFAARAHDLNPLEERQLLVLARSALKTTDYKAAQFAWKKLHELNPSLPEPLLQSARYHQRFKEFAEASDACRKLLALQPDHAEAVRILEVSSAVLTT